MINGYKQYQIISNGNVRLDGQWEFYWNKLLNYENFKHKTITPDRYEGEELVCVLPDTGIDGAINVAEDFRAGILALQIPHAYSSAGSYVTISQGVAHIFPSKDSEPRSLIMAADEALYRAKESGRNRVGSLEVKV